MSNILDRCTKLGTKDPDTAEPDKYKGLYILIITYKKEEQEFFHNLKEEAAHFHQREIVALLKKKEEAYIKIEAEDGSIGFLKVDQTIRTIRVINPEEFKEGC